MDTWAVLAAALLGVVTAPLVPRTAAWAAGREVQAYPTQVVAAGSALALGALAAGVGWSPALPAFVVLGLGAVVLVVVDLRLHRLPDRLTLPSAAVGLGLLALASVPAGSWSRLGRAALGGLVLLVVYAVMHLASGAGLGAGDVKYAGVLGVHLAWVGWPTLVLGVVAGFVAGGIAAVGLMALGRAGRRTRLAFGPAMVLGAVAAVALGDTGARTLLGW